MEYSEKSKKVVTERLGAEFLVARREGFKGVHVAVVKAMVESPDLEEEAPFLAALKRAATGWVSETSQGRDAWSEACEDFNIGDMGNVSYPESTLIPYLEREGIFHLDITIHGGGCRIWNFDTILAEPDSD